MALTASQITILSYWIWRRDHSVCSIVKGSRNMRVQYIVKNATNFYVPGPRTALQLPMFLLLPFLLLSFLSSKFQNESDQNRRSQQSGQQPPIKKTIRISYPNYQPPICSLSLIPSETAMPPPPTPNTHWMHGTCHYIRHPHCQSTGSEVNQGIGCLQTIAS